MTGRNYPAEYVRYKLGQVYAARGAITWLLGLIGSTAAVHMIYGPDARGATLFLYLLATGVGYTVWLDYEAWKKEAEA